MTPKPPCQSNRHCLNWGFCNRCNPALAEAAQLVVQAIDKAGVPGRDSSAPYGQIMAVLIQAARPAEGAPCSEIPGCDRQCCAPVLPAAIIHACPVDGTGTTECCGKNRFEMPWDRLTRDPALVTCTGTRQPPANG